MQHQYQQQQPPTPQRGGNADEEENSSTASASYPHHNHHNPRPPTRVRVELFASKLRNVAGAFKGTSDPYAIVTRLGDHPNDPPRILGKTEVLKNTLSPHWTTHFTLEYTLGRQTRINVGVYDEIRKADVDKPMGSAVFEMGDILGSRGNIKAKKLRQGGTLFCRVTPIPSSFDGEGGQLVHGTARIVLRGLHLKSTHKLARNNKPSPFFEVHAQTTAAAGMAWRTLYRSQPVHNEPHPIWPAFDIPLDSLLLSNGNGGETESTSYQHTSLRIQVWDYHKSGKHRNMGRIETTLEAMFRIQKPGAVQTNNPQEVDISQSLLLKVKGKDVGVLVVGQVHYPPPQQLQQTPKSTPAASIPPVFQPPSTTPLHTVTAPLAAALPETTQTPSSPPLSTSFLGYDDLPPPMAPPPKQRPQFIDYITGGCELELCIAIDFTGSNGDPRVPGTLHYMHPHNSTSSEDWNDYEKALMAVGGIVAKYDSDQKFPVWGFGAKYHGIIQHCFQIGKEAELSGLSNVLDAYRNVFYTGLTMSGPTVFDEVIQLAAAKARSQFQVLQSQGKQSYKTLLILTDGAVTDVEATKRAIQNASDAPLSIIIVGIGDADFSAMQFLDDFQNDIGGGRDICQFVEFRKYQHNKAALTEKTLEEIPDQLVDFFYTRNILPLPAHRLSQTSLSNILVEEVTEEDIDLSVAVDATTGGLYLSNTTGPGTYYDDTRYGPSAPTTTTTAAAASYPSYVPPKAYPVYNTNTNSSFSSSSYVTAAAAPVPPPAPSAVPPNIFYVQIPPNVHPGQQLCIQHPGTGQDMIVVIPAGVSPGGKFAVRW
jgi:hypothetical protein